MMMTDKKIEKNVPMNFCPAFLLARTPMGDIRIIPNETGNTSFGLNKFKLLLRGFPK